MNQHSDIERVLNVWMADGPTAIPDRVVDVVAARIDVQRQRRGWPFSRGRTSVTPIKLLAGLAAALVVAVVGYSLIPRQPSVGGPTSAPSTIPSVAPTPTAASTPTAAAFTCDDPAFTCAGPLAAGEHRSTAFRPALSFTVDAGWKNTLDRDRAYTLHDNFAPEHFFQVLSEVAIPEQDATCSAKRKAGAGNTVADWASFLTKHPGLVATKPQAITVGGFDGVRIDVHVATTWTATCPNSLGPAVMLVTDNGAVPDRTRWIDDQNTTFRILDVAGETVIIYVESGHTDANLASVNAALQPVIDTFKFTL
jgi:hypothetical protein